MTACVENAAARWVGGARDLTLQLDPLASAAIDRGHRREQRLGVGVVGPVEDGGSETDLHQPPEVEDRDAVRDVAHHTEVVGDKEIGDPLPLLELDEEVEDGGLDRHVQRGGRLIADDQPRCPGEGLRDRDALLEAS